MLPSCQRAGVRRFEPFGLEPVRDGERASNRSSSHGKRSNERGCRESGPSLALVHLVSDRSYKTIVSFKYALKGEAMHQEIRGRWQAQSLSSLYSLFFSFAHSLFLARVHPCHPRCRSALKIPAWNPWEPRRTTSLTRITPPQHRVAQVLCSPFFPPSLLRFSISLAFSIRVFSFFSLDPFVFICVSIVVSLALLLEI